MPIRGPVTIFGVTRRASSANGGSSSASPLCSSVSPSAWQSLPGPEQSDRSAATPAPRAHDVELARRLERSDQNRLGAAGLVADEVQAPVDAVRAVDVRVARCAEHDRVPGRLPAEAVARGILLVVGLDLDDPPADAVDEQRDADQVGRDLVDGAGEESARETRAGRRRQNS